MPPWSDRGAGRMAKERRAFDGKTAQSVCAKGDPISVEAQFHEPPARFEGCFTSFYHMSLDIPDGGQVVDYLQPEWANIRFFGGSCPKAEIGTSVVSGAAITATGPSTLPCRFELGSSQVWGIGFLPAGWARFVGGNAFEMANAVFDGAAHPVFSKFAGLSQTLCDSDASVEEQLDAICDMMDRLAKPHRDEAKIRRVHCELVDGDHASVCDLADACAMSIRTLERVCRRHFGFTPKLLMRRQRFMRTLTTFVLHKGSRWTEAMDDAYHDQAQFTREFCEFMTMTPSEYAAREHPILDSFIAARARIRGSAAQALDAPEG